MKEYRLGGRFRKFRNLCMIIVAAIVFGFYFIYDYLFEQTEWWDPKIFAYVFVLVGFLFVVLTGIGLNSILNTMRYRLLDNALEVSCWGNSKRYYYKDFKEAFYRGWGPFDTIPIVFVMKDRRNMELNQYLVDLAELTSGLLEKIRPYATLQDGLEQRIKNIR